MSDYLSFVRALRSRDVRWSSPHGPARLFEDRHTKLDIPSYDFGDLFDVRPELWDRGIHLLDEGAPKLPGDYAVLVAVDGTTALHHWVNGQHRLFVHNQRVGWVLGESHPELDIFFHVCATLLANPELIESTDAPDGLQGVNFRGHQKGKAPIPMPERIGPKVVYLHRNATPEPAPHQGGHHASPVGHLRREHKCVSKLGKVFTRRAAMVRGGPAPVDHIVRP